MTKERLIAIFKVNGPPYMLEYRRMGRQRKDWLADVPLLSEMMKEGAVKEIQRTRKTILYKYEPVNE